MALGTNSAKDVMEAISKNGIQFVDVKFTYLYGQWHHFSLPI